VQRIWWSIFAGDEELMKLKNYTNLKTAKVNETFGLTKFDQGLALPGTDV
jgi:hypothetical protein